eukprot:m.97175 g.97175  ORF g.97175 m.97175 type:complete len:204 (-) comp13584_c0_seq2:1041-1652(-)
MALPKANSYYTCMGQETAPVQLEVYLDYCCPFSAKLYKTVFHEVLEKANGKVAFTLRHQIQPWHPQSTYVHEAALAVKQLSGDGAFWKYSTALFEKQVDFFDANVFSLSRDAVNDMLVKLAVEVCKVPGEKMKDLLSLLPEEASPGHTNRGNKMTNTVKACIKHSRQRGIHVSPTCVINGIEVDTSSSWTCEKWMEFLKPILS